MLARVARALTRVDRVAGRRAFAAASALDANDPALMPDLQGKVLSTKIVAVDERNGVARARTGVRGVVTYRLSELENPEVRVGDVVEARVTWMNNPIGTLDLETSGLRKRKSRERVWRELLEARDQGKAVKGRILNAVNGGYAVGIAGVIAFCPTRAFRGRAPPQTAEKAAAHERATGKRIEGPIVGELLNFRVLKMTSSGEHYRNVVVSGPLGGGVSEKRLQARARNSTARSWGPNARRSAPSEGDETGISEDGAKGTTDDARVSDK